MKFRTIYVPLIIFVVLVAFVVFFESKKPTEEEMAEMAKLVFAVAPDDVDALQLVNQGSVVLEKFGDEWRMIEPVETGADMGSIRSILGQFENMRANRVLEEGISDPSAYGLDQPRAVIRLSSHGDSYSLEVGDLNSTETSYFARVKDDNRLLLLPKQSVDSFIDKTAFDLREKRVFMFPESEVRSFTVSSDERVTVAIEDEGWMITEPKSTEADKPGVEGLLRSARNMRASEFIDSPGDVSDYGLDAPRVTLEVDLGDSTRVVMLGDRAGDNTIYGMTQSSGGVFKVPQHSFDGIAKDMLDLKDKTIYNFDRSLVKGFVFDGLGSSFAARKTGEGDWMNPITGDSLETDDIRSVLSRLSTLRAMSFEEGEWNELAPESTRISVSVEVTTGPVSILVMGKSDSRAYGRLRRKPDITRIPLGVYEAVRAFLPAD